MLIVKARQPTGLLTLELHGSFELSYVALDELSYWALLK